MENEELMDKILVLNFGGQYDQLIARRIRALHVFAEIKNYNKITPEEIRAAGYCGIVFTGGPHSVYAHDAPRCSAAVLSLGIPVLGICYGHQLLAFLAGGVVAPAAVGSEYGKTQLTVKENVLFTGVPETSVCWMSHTDAVQTLPPDFAVTAQTEHCICAAIADDRRKLYGVQFHPEVTHTAYGTHVLENFVFRVCGCKGGWQMEDVAKAAIEKYQYDLRGKKVLLGLSGGVDSSVAAALLHRAIGDNLVCVFVDHGLLRKGEGDFVERTFRERFGLRLIRANAEARFLSALQGVTDPEKKRKIIGTEFVRVFEEEAKKLGQIDVLAQGTIYPDVIESGKDNAATIKSHHNVGGLPAHMAFSEIVEPLHELFKDEVRAVGETLGLPRELVWRQPFPGPGLGVRVLGEVTKEKLEILREADAVFREVLEQRAPEDLPNQYFAVLTGSRSVGVMGDERTYGYTVALRAVTTDDFMTATWTRLPYDILEEASSRITNEVKGVSRVVYDVTSKPPATVEWE